MGLFIVFEGIEGCGKTTQIHLLHRYLEGRGVPVISTREPGGTLLGEEIRRIFLNSKHQDILPMAELALINAARIQHIHEVIRPSREAGRIVLCDRFIGATIAYQGCAGGVPRRVIDMCHNLFCNGLKPDITILLDCPAIIGLERSRKRIIDDGTVKSEGRFEQKDISFHERVRQGYLMLIEENPAGFIVIDARLEPEEVHRKLIDELLPWLRRNGYAI